MRVEQLNFPLPIPSKKNSKQIFKNKSTGRSFITSSKAYKEWHRAMSYIFNNIKPFEDRIEIGYFFFPENKRRLDMSNKIESINDFLVDKGIIKEDHIFILSKFRSELCYIDKDNPRVEVIIKDYI